MQTSAPHMELIRQFQPEEIEMVDFVSEDFAQLVSGVPVAEDVEVEFISTLASETRAYRGLQGLIAGWRDWLAPWASYHVKVERLIDAGDGRVLVPVHVTARTRHDGVTVEHEPAVLYTVRDGLIVSARFYLNRADLPGDLPSGSAS